MAAACTLARRAARARIVAVITRCRLGVDPEELRRRIAGADRGWWSAAGRVLEAAQLELREFVADLALPGGDPATIRDVALHALCEGAVAWSVWGQRGRALHDCGRFAKILRCGSCSDQNAVVLVPELCQSRYCPDCCKRNRRRTARRLEVLLERFRSPPRFLTLTVRSAGDLVATRRVLQVALQKFRARKWVRDRMRGGFCALEVTHGHAGWHPHYHIAFDGLYLPWARMVDEWMSCCGCTCHRPRGDDRTPVMCCRARWTDDDRFATCTDPTCSCTGSEAAPAGQFVKRITKRDAVRELAKYCAKELGEAQPNLPPEDLCQLLQCTFGRRMLTTFGVHYDPELEAEDEEIFLRALRDADNLDQDPRCPVCGAKDLHQTGYRAIERAPP